MTSIDWQLLDKEMRELFKRDKTITHIQLNFNIQPVQTEKKIGIINIKTYKDGKNSKR